MNCQQCGAQLEPGTNACPNCDKKQSILTANIPNPLPPAGAIKNPFSFRGRAKRLEYWLSLIVYVVLFNILLGILAAIVSNADDESTATVFIVLFAIIFVVLTIPLLAVSARRLHDLGMSGFWLIYLNCFGLPVIYLVYLLDLDKSCNRVVEKVWNNGHPWLSWIITTLFWWLGAPISLFLLFMYEGKHEDNEFGLNPYKD